MDAEPFLKLIAESPQAVRLDAILVGNAAAALQGAPVTTLDFDFMFRNTPANLGKLKLLARRLGAVILCPYYPASDLYRVVVEDTGLQLDFMPTLTGIRSFASLRSRATRGTFGRAALWVASLADVIASAPHSLRRSSTALPPVIPSGSEEPFKGDDQHHATRLVAGVPSPESCFDKLSMTRASSPSPHRLRRRDRLERLKAGTEKAELEQIRRLLALPMEKRTHFLRRTGFTGSAL